MQEQSLEYWHRIGSVPAEDIVAVDETEGRAWSGKLHGVYKGKKVYCYRQKNRGQKYTLIGAISKEKTVTC